MATTSVSVIASSLASLSFSSQISQNFQLSSLCFSKSLSLPKDSRLVISASAVTAPSPVEDIETEDFKSLVKSRLPGGFAAQRIFGTGRRKSATARVVLLEGSGQIIINYRDAKVLTFYHSVMISPFSFIRSLNFGKLSLFFPVSDNFYLCVRKRIEYILRSNCLRPQDTLYKQLITVIILYIALATINNCKSLIVDVTEQRYL